MESKYAPAERAGKKILEQDFQFLKNAEYVDKLINSLPYIGAILNEYRQVVFANEKLLEILNLKTIDEIMGQRPGEVIHCVNAQNEIGGCGTSENCKVCGAVNCILKAQEENKKVSAECRITAKEGEKLIAFDFNITTAPFIWKDKVYYVFSMVDISNDKRRQAMERIFYHDVINKTGSMTGFIDLLKNVTDIEKMHEFIDLLDTLNQDLTNEILTQRDLAAAESGELIVEMTDQVSVDIIYTSMQHIRQHDVARNKMILDDPDAESFEIKTDGTQLRRILMNMLKNALEATNKGGAVKIGCNNVSGKKRFWVHNEGYIPRESQLQIFQRSFSTKGRGRGLGTYSMKLLGETYLKGEVGFESDEVEGTVFYIQFND